MLAGILVPFILLPIIFLFVRNREVVNSEEIGMPIDNVLKLRCTDEAGLSYRLHGGNCTFNSTNGVFTVIQHLTSSSRAQLIYFTIRLATIY